MEILIIEDDERMAALLKRGLEGEGHVTAVAGDGPEGLDFALSRPFDVVILDVMIPGLDGFEVARRLRQRDCRTPILMLTAKDAPRDIVNGLDLGADDYLTKPFALAELVARLEALARRRYAQPDPKLRVGPLEIDTAAKTVKRGGEDVPLTIREFALLECLARRPGQVFSREQIESRLYAELDGPLSNAVDSAICSLRRKLCQPGSPPLIHTRRGLGYVLEA